MGNLKQLPNRIGFEAELPSVSYNSLEDRRLTYLSYFCILFY